MPTPLQLLPALALLPLTAAWNAEQPGRTTIIVVVSVLGSLVAILIVGGLIRRAYISSRSRKREFVTVLIPLSNVGGVSCNRDTETLKDVNSIRAPSRLPRCSLPRYTFQKPHRRATPGIEVGLARANVYGTLVDLA